MKSNQTVFVGLSGGVDSSVAALRLLKQGYKVVGVFIKVWHPDFLVCNWEQERLDAMRVAAKLGIPFLTCDAEAEYRDAVAHYFIESYRAGLTPNPDVMCNKEVKFGAFMNFALAKGADFIATGHYAQKVVNSTGEHMMLRGLDDNKDQTYFLWTLTKSQLSKTLFPVGDSQKEIIRKEAEEADLITANKKDSQGVCFLGHIDIPDFLSHYIDLKEGDVIDDKGNLIGKHQGAFVYTVGQRHGFTITSQDSSRTPYYVVSKNIQNNTISVSKEKPQLTANTNIKLSQVNLNSDLQPGENISVQTRYRQTPFNATVLEIDNNTMTLKSDSSSEAIAVGQSCVLYRGQQCLGGGIIG